MDRDYQALLGKYADLPREQFIGKCVTLSLASSKRGVMREHVRIRVDAPEGEDELKGTLEEDPVFATKWKKGDTVTFWVEEIENVVEEDGAHE